jgi:hypothetical protein
MTNSSRLLTDVVADEDECCTSSVVRTNACAPGRARVLTRRVRLLVAATISYDVVEALRSRSWRARSRLRRRWSPSGSIQ